MTTRISYDWVSASDIDAAYKIEIAGYPPDEAASLSALQYRQLNAPDLFLGAYTDSHELIAFVVSTLSPSDTLTHASMSIHVPNSASVCIHSVCVHPEHRRMGIASNLLREYVKRLSARFRSQGIPERLLLITHEELRAFYEGVGFKWVGESEVQHGSRKWYEMRLVLPHEYEDDVTTTSSNQWQPSQEAILAALLASSSSRTSATHTTKSFDDFDNIQDLLVPDNTGTKMKNRYDLMCPRPGCGSIILRKEVGAWQRKESVVIDPIGNHTPLLPPLPQPPTETDWWLVGPSPMEFENIAFSKGVQNANGPRLKLLACGECDLGPVGWCEDAPRTDEFWIVPGRVGYRV